MISIDEGFYRIGTDDKNIGLATDVETPNIYYYSNSFQISKYTVTNLEFSKFVDSTGYTTIAEKKGYSYVFHSLCSEDQKNKAVHIKDLPWWLEIKGAYWKSPEGEDSNIEKRMDHPVVHISLEDAIAYCIWAGERLPTEAEWEIAAKGGTNYDKYPWGNDITLNGKYMCNVWQGDFPVYNSLADGYLGTAPVNTYPSNQFGLYQMIGNVWELCCNPPKIDLNEFNSVTSEQFWNTCVEKGFDYCAMKGGSFLCHPSYCNRNRIAGRNGVRKDTTSSNLGFRTVKSY